MHRLRGIEVQLIQSATFATSYVKTTDFVRRSRISKKATVAKSSLQSSVGSKESMLRGHKAWQPGMGQRRGSIDCIRLRNSTCIF